MLKIKKIKPLFNRILVTSDKYEKDIKQGEIVTVTAGTLKEYQRVLAVGPTVRDIKEGDLVLINPTRYAVRKHNEGSLKNNVVTDNPIVSYNFNLVELEGQICILLYDQDIDYVLEEFEEIPEKTSSLITPKKKLIV